MVSNLSKKHKLNDGEENTLMLLANVAAENGSISVSQECLARVRRKNTRTIRNHQTSLLKKNLISVERGERWQSKNSITVLFIKHLNINKEEKVSAYLLDPCIKDNTKETNYSEYSSIFSNSGKKEKKNPVKFADEEKLDGPDSLSEIMRICLAYLLLPDEISCVIQQMKDGSIVNKAKYLIWLCKGGWKMNAREDVGYSQYDRQKHSAKLEKPKKPLIDFVKRQEIKEWAESQALQTAKRLNKIRPTDYDGSRIYDEWFGREVQYHEKRAYYKIENKEVAQ